MDFWASSEAYRHADSCVDRARRIVEPLLNSLLAKSSLANLDCKLRYVPIVMPESMHARYPARSKLRRKARIYDCAPILNYDIFVHGAFEDQLREYVRGIALAAPHLAGLGASPEQIEDFKAILASVIERVIAERPDQTRR
jgi:hypothetical protein